MFTKKPKLRQIWVTVDQRSFFKREAAAREKTIPAFIDELIIKNDKKAKEEFKFKSLF